MLGRLERLGPARYTEPGWLCFVGGENVLPGNTRGPAVRIATAKFLHHVDVMIYTAHHTQAGHSRQSVGKIATMNEVKSSQQVVMISKKSGRCMLTDHLYRKYYVEIDVGDVRTIYMATVICPIKPKR